MTITAQAVKELRDQTGAGMMNCKKALTETGGDLQEAIKFLRTKGLAAASKKAHRAASDGAVVVTGDDSAMVVLELNCETDFVAKTDDFQNMVRSLAMHIAAANPAYLKREDVPSELIDKEKEIYASQVTNKPPQIVDKIVQGKLDKFYADNCLLEQVYVKDPEGKRSIQEVVVDIVARIRENVVLKRFVRFQLGEKIG